MGDGEAPDGAFDDLPFHEYCANCARTFDGAVLKPTVTVVEVDDERVIHSFCDEGCLSEWAPEE